MSELLSIDILGLKNYIKGTPVNQYVNFKVLDENNKVVKDKNNNPMEYVGYSCFAPITYNVIPSTVKRILIWRDIATLPYKYDFCVRWIAELNKLGFPCSICPALEENRVLFLVELADFQHKVHVNCTLQLVRFLSETYLVYIPDLYFKILDENTDIDAFQALQNACKKLSEFQETSYKNTNHMITYEGNFGNVTREKFFNNVERRQCDVYSNKDFSIHPLWADLTPK